MGHHYSRGSSKVEASEAQNNIASSNHNNNNNNKKKQKKREDKSIESHQQVYSCAISTSQELAHDEEAPASPELLQLSDFVGDYGFYQLALTLGLFVRYVFLGLMANSGPLMTPDVTFYCRLPMDEIVAIMPNITLLNYTEQQVEIKEEFKRICQLDLNLYQRDYYLPTNMTTTSNNFTTSGGNSSSLSSSTTSSSMQTASNLNNNNNNNMMMMKSNHTTSVKSPFSLHTHNHIRECADFDYEIALDQGRTMTSEFDLVCDRDWLRSLFQSLLSAAIVVAHVFWGTFSDKYGRFQAQKLCLLVSLLAGIWSIFAPDFWTFVLARSLCSFGDLGLVVSLTTTVVELVGSRYRGLSVAIVNFGFALGVTILPYLVAYFEDFRLLITFTVFCHLLSIPLILMTNESVRWLLTNRKFKQAKRELKRISRWNRNSTIFFSSLFSLQKLFKQQQQQQQQQQHATYKFNAKRLKLEAQQQKAQFNLLYERFCQQIESQNQCDPHQPTPTSTPPNSSSHSTTPTFTQTPEPPPPPGATTVMISINREQQDIASNQQQQQQTYGDLVSEPMNLKPVHTCPLQQEYFALDNKSQTSKRRFEPSRHEFPAINLRVGLIGASQLNKSSQFLEIPSSKGHKGDQQQQHQQLYPKLPAFNHDNHLIVSQQNPTSEAEKAPPVSLRKAASFNEIFNLVQVTHNSPIPEPLPAIIVLGDSARNLNQHMDSSTCDDKPGVADQEMSPMLRHYNSNCSLNSRMFSTKNPLQPDKHHHQQLQQQQQQHYHRRHQQPDCINLVTHQLSFVTRVNRLFKDKKLMIAVFTIVWTTFNSELQYTSYIIINLEVGEDVYLNYILGGCMEALAAISASLLLSYAPRRHSLITFWLLISLSCFGLSIAHIDSTWAVWLLALAKFSQSCLSSIASVAAYESFPTFLRQSGSGLVFTLGMLGSVFAPLIFAEFDDQAGMDRVLMTFSVSSLTAAILIYLFLQETRDCELS